MNLMYFLLLWYGFEATITSQFYFNVPISVVNSAKKIDEVIILLMLIKIVMNYFNFQSNVSSSFKRYSFYFLFIILLSSLINFVNLPIIIEYYLRYCKWIIIVFYCHMYIRWNEHHYYKFWKYINYFFIVQFFINALWYFNIVLIPNSKLNHRFDWALGTMGHSFYIALFTGIILCGHIYIIMKFRKGMLRKYNSYIFIILSIIQLLFTHTNHLVLIIPGLIIFIIFVLPIIKIRYKIIFMLISSLNFLYLNTSINVFEILNKGMDRVKYSPKALTYKYSFVTMPNEVAIGIIGAGPGNAGSFIGKENKTTIAKNYFIKYDVVEIRSGSILTAPYTGLASIQSELGIIGTICFILVSIRILIILFRRNKINNRYYPFNYQSLVIFVSFFFFLLFLTENLLGDFLQHSFFPILTWFMVAISIQKTSYIV